MDAVCSPFKGGAFGETEHGVLGGNIGRHPGGSDKGTVGSDVDDGALLLGDHLLHGIFHTEKGPEYIDVVDTDEVAIRLVRDCGVGAFIPGIIDLHIETAVIGDGLLEIALMGNPQPSTCSSGMHKTRLRVLHLYRRGFWAISAF